MNFSIFFSALFFAFNVQAGFDTWTYRIRSADHFSPAFPASEVDQKFFDQTLLKIKNFYTPVFQKQGMTLLVKSIWENDELSAKSYKLNGMNIISFRGGLARLNYVTKDSWVGIVCHEVGHHLGNYPQYKNDTMASEGQADYYAGAKCLKQIWKNDPSNRTIAEGLNLPGQAKSDCAAQFKNSDEYYICLRIAKVAEDFGRIFHFMRNNTDASFISILNPDRSVVPNTLEGYASAQCRTDTVYQAALCDADPNAPFGKKDAATGACTGRTGARPSCWFAN